MAQNSLEALEAVKKNRYDAVLMDVQMPIMGGFEATEKIRLWEKEMNPIDPFSVRVPIIALTAHAMQGDCEKCLQSQMDEYISKPLKPNLLSQTMSKTIHQVSKLKELSSMNQHNQLLESEGIDPFLSHNSPPAIADDRTRRPFSVDGMSSHSKDEEFGIERPACLQRLATDSVVVRSQSPLYSAEGLSGVIHEERERE